MKNTNHSKAIADIAPLPVDVNLKIVPCNPIGGSRFEDYQWFENHPDDLLRLRAPFPGEDVASRGNGSWTVDYPQAVLVFAGHRVGTYDRKYYIPMPPDGDLDHPLRRLILIFLACEGKSTAPEFIAPPDTYCPLCRIWSEDLGTLKPVNWFGTMVAFP